MASPGWEHARLAITVGMCAYVLSLAMPVCGQELGRTHVLTVTGVVSNANRAPVGGWKVLVRSETRGWEHIATSGFAVCRPHSRTS